MFGVNVAAIVNLGKVVRNPSLCLPQHTVQTFADLPVPLSRAFIPYQHGDKSVEIRAVVLDKDNCFAAPGGDQEKFQELIKTYSADNILVVSNSAGCTSADPTDALADALEQNIGVKVLRHDVEKPGCKSQILSYFHGRASADQIAVVGDRLFTDIAMGNAMGSYNIWIRRGVIPSRDLVTRAEYGISQFLYKRGFRAPHPVPALVR